MEATDCHRGDCHRDRNASVAWSKYLIETGDVIIEPTVTFVELTDTNDRHGDWNDHSDDWNDCRDNKYD